MKVKKKRLAIAISIILAAILAVVLFFMNRSPIHFVKNPQIEIHSLVDYQSFVEEVDKGQVSDLHIDSSKVNVDQLGEYPVDYEFNGKTYTLDIEVVDTKAPEVILNDKKVALNQNVSPEYFIDSIKDQTKTNVSFKKKYKFDKLEDKEVVIIIEDEGHNKIEKTIKTQIVEDTKKPVITAGNQSVIVGSKVDLKSLIQVEDDFDTNPTVTINDSGFDPHKIGKYKVEIVAKDFSGNESRKSIFVQVIDKTGKNEKVVYLTFDDGPSRHTPEVLDILKKYDCKASFFITGMNPQYRKYIKIAHDQGHTIGLHTYSHDYSEVYASTDAFFKDLNKVGAVAKEYLGFVPRYIRFPGGSSNTISRKYTPGIMTKLTKMVEEKGYDYYDWNAENGDGYSHMSKSEMYRRATMSNQNQIMILMHDSNGKQNTVDILPSVIEHYQKKGYTFKAIDDSSMVPHQQVNN